MSVKNKKILFVFILLLTDCLTFIFSVVFSFHLRFDVLVNLFSSNIVYPFNEFVITACCIIPVWIIFVNSFVGYNVFYMSVFDLFIKTLKASVSFLIFVSVLMFVIKSDVSRILIVFSWINLTLFTFVFRYIFKKTISLLIYKLKIRNNLLVIGKNVRKYKKVLKKNEYINKVFYYPYMLDTNNIEKLKKLSIKKNIKELIISEYGIKDNEFLSLCDWAQINDVNIKILPTEAQLIRDKTVIDDKLQIPVILLISNPIKEFDYFLKRVFDRIFAFVFLVILSPLFLIIAALIKLESKGTVFYKQTRVGYDKKKFLCYKFRSMYNNADNKLQTLKQNNNNIFFKMENDPRITKTGKFIRKYSIDELPQLINVLKGQMSLVGPRPMIEREVEEISRKYHNYSYNKMFKVLPGITGLWQVSGRSLLTDEKRLELDIFYVDNWSLKFDVKILLKTVVAVIFTKGAY